MSKLKIQIESGQTSFTPGDTIAGNVSWQFDDRPDKVALRLIWFTRGKGTEDVGIVEETEFDGASAFETRQFRLKTPLGPYSYSGSLLSIIWAIEAMSEDPDDCERIEVVISPTGNEVRI